MVDKLILALILTSVVCVIVNTVRRSALQEQRDHLKRCYEQEDICKER